MIRFRPWAITTAGWGVLAVLAVMLAGCSGGGGRYFSGWQDALEVEIRPNTSKLFVYRVASPHGARPLVEVQRSSGSRSQRRRHDPMDAQAVDGLRKDAGYAVAATGYCRDGFLTLDYRLSHAESWLRGECRESATDADRERFADGELTIPKPES